MSPEEMTVDYYEMELLRSRENFSPQEPFYIDTFLKEEEEEGVFADDALLDLYLDESVWAEWTSCKNTSALRPDFLIDGLCGWGRPSQPMDPNPPEGDDDEDDVNEMIRENDEVMAEERRSHTSSYDWSVYSNAYPHRFH
jgi:hypothetical protein